MDEEYCSLMENDTWDLVTLLKGRKLVILCKWVYISMYAFYVIIGILKERIVAKGFS